jgi:hypothetical protein
MFENAKLKHNWANQHIVNFQAACAQFIQGNRHHIYVQADPNGGISIELSFDKPIPPTIALMIGDAVHNFNTALDYATWELIGLDKGVQDRYLKFPSGDNKVNYEASCNGINTPRPDTKEFFKRFSNYDGGNFLRSLHLLDNREKHTTLTALVGATRVPHMKIIDQNGRMIEETQNISFLMEADGRTHFRIRPGHKVELYDQHNTTIEVFIAEFPLVAGIAPPDYAGPPLPLAQPLPGQPPSRIPVVLMDRPQPALPMLHFMSQGVAGALTMFDDFVRTRPP